MGSLIKNELIKIFKKKSTYVVLIILSIFIIFSSCMYRFIINLISKLDYRMDDTYISMMKDNLNSLDPEKDREEYINTKTDIDFYNVFKENGGEDWKKYLLERDFYDYIYNVNLYKYGTNEQKQSFSEDPQVVLDNELKKLNTGTWQQYVSEEIDTLEKKLDDIKQIKYASEQANNSAEIDEQIKLLQIKLDLSRKRLEKNIPYGEDYLNQAIELVGSVGGMNYNVNKPEMSYQEKLIKQMEIENLEKAKYVVETGKDINNEGDLRGSLMQVFDKYSIFITIFIVMVAGGIISTELEKGTIKMLLVKPYTRTKILLAKYIVSMLMTVFILIAVVVLQVVLGGIILGFSSLSTPAVVYNFATNSIETYNIFTYVFIIAINKLPMYILLVTFAFAISSLSGSTVLGIILPVIANMAGAVVNQIIGFFSIKQLAFLPTLNWDFTEFLFGKLPFYEFTNLGFASVMCVIYWAILFVVAVVIFRRKEIRNV